MSVVMVIHQTERELASRCNRLSFAKGVRRPLNDSRLKFWSKPSLSPGLGLRQCQPMLVTLVMSYILAYTTFPLPDFGYLWRHWKNWKLSIFGSKFAEKWILGSKYQKSKSGFALSTLEILWVAILTKKGKVWIFGSKFVPKWILRSEFEKSKSRPRTSILETLCAPILTQKWQVVIFEPKFPQERILKSEFQKSKARFGIKILEIYMHQFPIKREHIWAFGAKFAQKSIFGVGI